MFVFPAHAAAMDAASRLGASVGALLSVSADAFT
jgi:hypothetical protein